MKKIISLILTLCLVATAFCTVYAAEEFDPTGWNPVDVGGDSDAANDYYWKVENNTLYLHYIGAAPDYTGTGNNSATEDRPWIVADADNQNVTKVVMTGNPGRIGKNTFIRMKQITSVEFPDTITEIATGAFQMCMGLKGAFIVPASVTKIYDHAFQHTTITSLIFEGTSETTEALDLGQLTYLYRLKNITLMRPIKFATWMDETKEVFGTNYGDATFAATNPARINLLVTKAEYAAPLINLTGNVGGATETNNALELGVAPGKFEEYTLIDEITPIAGSFYDGVDYLLYHDQTDGLTVEFITNASTTLNVDIGADLMNGYSGPTSNAYTINDTTLASNAANIKKMVFSEGFEKIPAQFGTNTGATSAYGTGIHTLYSALEEIDFPSTLTEIGEFAFCRHATLSKINLEDTKLAKTGQKVFAYSAIENVAFPKTIAQIGDQVFVGNTVLDTVYLPATESLKVGMGVFAREWAQTGFAGKNLKVIMDGPFTVGDDNVKATAFCRDSVLSITVPYRTTTLIYDSTKMTAPSGLEAVTTVADKYYDIHDTDGDGKINLFMFTFGEDQPYKLFAGVYEGEGSETKLSNVIDLAEGTAAKGNLINAEYPVSADAGKTTKVFLWDGFINLTPLDDAL